MIRATKGLAAQRPPLMPTPTKPGPSIAQGLARAVDMRSTDLSTLSRVCGQSKAITAEVWFSRCDWTDKMLAREQARRF